MSAVIIIGLVVMWAVVLIPMWLRRHDEHEESRSVDRFTTAMHTLSRREAKQARESKPSVAAERYGLMPRQVRNVEVHVSGASAPEPRRARSAQARPGLTAAQRRRRTLTGLLLVTIVFLVAAALTGNLVLWMFQVIADLAIAAFVVHLRRMAIASASTRSVRPAPRRAAPEPVARRAPRVEPAYETYDEQYNEDDYDEPVEPAPRVTVRRFASESTYAQPATYAEPVTYAEPAYDDYDDEVAPAPAAVFDQYDEPAAYQPVEYDEPSQPAASAAPATVVFDQFDESAAQPQPDPEPRRSFIEAGAQPGRGVAEQEPAPQPARETARVEPARDEPFRYEPEAQAPQAPAASVGGSPWEPVPVPRPTYTMKPAAPPRRRRDPIDEPLLPPVETAAEMDPADELEEILDRRWAVND